MKDAQLAPLEAAAEDAGVDPTHFLYHPDAGRGVSGGVR